MSKIRHAMRQNEETLHTRTAKAGGYSFVATIFVLIILVLVNIAVSSLPSTWIQYDISSAQLYSVTSATKAEVQNLTEEVTIYWITQAGEEDSVIEKLLNVYDALSDYITVEEINPDVYPTFAEQYTDETVENNSLVVESGDTYRYISYSDIYEYDYSDYYTTGSVSYSFDGESEITSAIDYVVSDDLPIIYVLTGHGEADFSDSMTESLEKANIETEELTLLTVDEIPEDAEAIMIYAPTSDFSEEEITMLTEYLEAGGRLFVISGPQEEDEMTNLHSLLESYGVTTEEGIVVEGSRDNYAFGYPYVLLPETGDSDITSALSENNIYIISAFAQGLTIGETADSVTVTSLLDTTTEAFSKISGFSLSTYDKEDGDIDGAFSVAVSIEDADTEAMMVWISTDYIMDDTYVSYSSGANSDFVINALSWLIGETDSLSIRSKSMSYDYLTINTNQANMIKISLIGVIPICFLLYGVIDVRRRRKNS